MTARTHDLGAITALGLVTLVAPLPSISLSTAVIALLANQFGGIAPDIDQPTAPLWRNLPTGGFFGRIIDKMLGGHRFLSHSLIGVVIFAVLSNLLLHFLHPIMPHVDILIVWYAFLIGLASHLVMDTFTKEGVPWLLPFPIKIGLPPTKRFRITTGKSAETFLVFPILLIFDFWLFYNHYTAIFTFIRHQLLH